jgi:RNA polymerase sigma-70 factor (ECF subfamily)
MICLRYLRENQDAQDVLQNALIKIYSNLKTFDINRGSFKSWSSKIVVNECIMFLRKRSRSFFYNELQEELEIHDNSYTPIEKISAEEITQLILQLPVGYRLVFNLFAIEGYSHKEIAETLSISIGTSKSQLFKAKKMLKEKVTDIFETVYP